MTSLHELLAKYCCLFPLTLNVCECGVEPEPRDLEAQATLEDEIINTRRPNLTQRLNWTVNYVRSRSGGTGITYVKEIPRELRWASPAGVAAARTMPAAPCQVSTVTIPNSNTETWAPWDYLVDGALDTIHPSKDIEDLRNESTQVSPAEG